MIYFLLSGYLRVREKDFFLAPLVCRYSQRQNLRVSSQVPWWKSTVVEASLDMEENYGLSRDIYNGFYLVCC